MFVSCGFCLNSFFLPHMHVLIHLVQASCNTTKFNSLSSMLMNSGLYITSLPLVQAVGILSVISTLPIERTPENIQNSLLRMIAMCDLVILSLRFVNFVMFTLLFINFNVLHTSVNFVFFIQ